MSNNYTETELQLILNKITSAQANTITMNEGELYLAPDDAVYSVNNVTPTNGNINIPEGANKDLSNLSSTGNSKFQAPITGGASTITSSNLTTNRALVSNSSGKVTVSSVTLSELGYVSGVKSKIQTQLNNKVTSNSAITGATKCKITYDSKGLVTSGTNLSASDIPDLSATYYLASNPNGYTSNTGTVTSVNNVKPVNGNVSLTIPSEVTESTVSGWGFTKNTGTVTSVNNIQPVNGNVTIDTGATRNIGEIIQSTIPLTDAGLHLLDGALIDGNGIYSAFVDYIASIYDASANYFCTEAQWQTSVTNYGVCGKFVYDSVNNTVRLPKITGFIEGASGVANLSDLTEAGLPNITGTTAGHDSVNSQGAFSRGGHRYQNTTTTYANGTIMDDTFDASRSSSIYGNSTTVQPQSIKVLYYIVVATSTKTDIQVDIDEIATDLNGKADVDLSNVPSSKGILTESYVNGSSWYRVYSDGWCEQGGILSFTARRTFTNTISLLKSFINTNYTCIANLRSNEPNDTFITGYNIANMTTSSFLVTGNTYENVNINTGIIWQACGYIR